MKIVKPNYRNRSIVNLMSSIGQSFGWKSSYNPLAGFKIKNKKIILIIIDGLGYNWLNKYAKESFLYKHLKRKITTVFPSTTLTAITSFCTGLPAQQSAMTGWYMYTKETGSILVPLPFQTRAGRNNLADCGISVSDICVSKSIYKSIGVKTNKIISGDYIDSPFNKTINNSDVGLPYTTMSDFFSQVSKILASRTNESFTHAYWAEFDYFLHRYGVKSKKVRDHFYKIDRGIERVSKKIDNDTTVIITADHGQVTTYNSKHIIKMQEHPKFYDTLRLPLCGEGRAAYCYVKPDRVNDFKKYVKTIFRNVCSMYKSIDLIERGYFGLGEVNDSIYDRVGDYILVMKNDYIMKDFVLGEEKKIMIGNHGGLSEDEMFVPLITINNQ